MFSDFGELTSKLQEKAPSTIVEFLHALNQRQILTSKVLTEALSDHIEFIEDLRCDVPAIGKITGEIIGGLIVKKMFEVKNLWSLIEAVGERQDAYLTQQMKQQIYLSALKEVCTKTSKLYLLNWQSLGLTWEKILGEEKLCDIHKKLSDYGLSFLHSPKSPNLEEADLVDFIRGCNLKVADKDAMKNFFIGYLRNLYFVDGQIKDPEYEALCQHLEAVKKVFDVTVELIVGMQAICLLNGSPDTKLFELMFDAGKETKTISPESFKEFEDRDGPYTGTFATTAKRQLTHSEC